MRRELPAGVDELPDTPLAQAATDAKVLHGEVQDTRPPVCLHDRQRAVRNLSIAVVEGDDDRPRRQRPASMPLVPDGALRDGVVAVTPEPSHLPGELGFTDVELRIGSAGGGI